MDVDAASDCDAVEDGDDAGKAGSGDDRVLLLLSSALHDEASSALIVGMTARVVLMPLVVMGAWHVMCTGWHVKKQQKR